MADTPDEVALRRSLRDSSVDQHAATTPRSSGKGGSPDDAPMLNEWMLAQRHHTDPDKAAAAAEVFRRWDLEFVSMARIQRVFQTEGSPHLRALRELLDEYREIFDIPVGDRKMIRQMGASGMLTPIAVEYCERCSKEAIPGTGLCGRHGGQWITEDERQKMSAEVRDRLTLLGARAIGTLEDLMDNAKSEQVRMQTAMTILDRIGSPTEVKVTHGFGADAQDKAANIIQNRLDRLAEATEAAEQARYPDEVIIDAEIV